MLKFGGSRPESDGNDAKDRKQRHQRSAAAATGGPTGMPGTSAVVPGNGNAVMAGSGGGGGNGVSSAVTGGETTPKPLQQMAPPDIPFGTGQPPVV